MPMYYNNQTAICIACNPVFHEKTKHIEADCNFIRDAVTQKLISILLISILFTSSYKEVTNMFTKLNLMLLKFSLSYVISCA